MSYNIVASTTQSTVVAEYNAEDRAAVEYQSEAELEREFIRLLSGQGYEFLTLTDEAGLVANLRRQLETLNGITFTDGEWDGFFKTQLASSNEGIVEKTRKIQARDRKETLSVCIARFCA